jgi:hypothetical protein
MPFSNPQVIRLANSNLRPLADQVVSFSYAVDGFVKAIDAQGIPAILAAANATDLIQDGSPQDGRPALTVQGFIDFVALIRNASTSLANTGVVQKAMSIQVNGIPQG